MNIKMFHLFAILFLIRSWCKGANILFLSEVPSLSHHLWLRTVAVELARIGHNITFASCDVDVSQPFLHFIHMENVYDSILESDGYDLSISEMGNKNIFLQYLDTPQLVLAVCNGLIRSNGWQQLNNYPDDFKFDLFIHDYMTGSCLLSFRDKFNNPPLVSMTAFRDNSFFHKSTKTAVIPSRNTLPYFYHQAPTSFLERTANFILHMFENIIWKFCVYPNLTKMIQESNIANHSALVTLEDMKSVIFLTNYNSAVDEPQQLPPNVIGVGGLQIKPPSKLPDDLQGIADGAVNGLIYFSLGTNMRSQELGESIITSILECFEFFPEYTFLWKIDLENDIILTPNNVVIRKWFPQNDVLAHKHTKLFITHGGLMSTQEAIWHNVPMLGIPLFFDQYSNVHNAVNKGIAEVLYIKDLTSANLCAKILILIHNPKFKENMQVFSNAFHDQKETPLERAIWWIEWTMRNPNRNVSKGYGEDLNFLQIESVDVISFLILIVIFCLYVTIRIAGICFRVHHDCRVCKITKRNLE